MATESSWNHSWIGELKGRKTTCIIVTIKGPTCFEGAYIWNQSYYGTRITHKPCWIFGWVPEMYYVILGPDISGSTFYDDIGFFGYPYNGQLPPPDIKCDIRDIALAVKAFGSYPGYARWEMGLGDVNNDYKVDIEDIANFARRFGWSG